MRVAFMHRQLSDGGTEADLRRLAAGLAGRGHAVHVFCVRPSEAPPGVTVRRVRILRGGRLVRLLSFAAAAPRAVSREPWDVVVGFGRTPRQDVVRVGGGTHRSYLARMAGAGLRSRRLGPYHRAILWLEARQFTPGAYHRVLTVSALSAREIAQDYAVPSDRLAVVYNGVDGERFDPARRAALGPPVRRELGIPPETPLCAAIGSGFQRKGFDLLLALWRRSPPRDARLVLVGDDERLAAWRRLPSRQEAFGNVVLEACAAGVPVVTSRRAGAAELLDGALASLVVDDPEDLDALGHALETALGPEHDSLASAARRRAEALPWDAHVARVESLLQEVAHGT